MRPWETLSRGHANPRDVQPTRKQVLFGVFVATVLFAAAVLADVLWTAFFGVTVAYVLVPVVAWFREQGLSKTWASVFATATGTAGLVGLFGLLVYLVYRRRDSILEFISTLPDSITIEAAGYTYVLTVEAATEAAVQWVTAAAVEFATSLPTIALKVTVFAFVVFGLLLGHEAVEEAVLAVVPQRYHDIAGALADRTRETLYSIYVLQAATGVGTFIVSLPVFFLLGYDIPVTLSFIAGVLQFLPIVGPSVLLGVLAIYQLTVGAVFEAVLVLVVGGVVIAWLPDILIRPRLARLTSKIPGTLYFIGFVGGLLTVGAVGIIAGPLAVALLVEAVGLLGDDEEMATAERPG